VDARDIDLLCQGLHEGDGEFDLTGDGSTTDADLTFLIESILGTTIGDANLDGTFDSADLVLVFQNAEYEDDPAGNSGWQDGDWNCDGEFNTSDLVAAFQAGGYRA
jgi:hypothetical protein